MRVSRGPFPRVPAGRAGWAGLDAANGRRVCGAMAAEGNRSIRERFERTRPCVGQTDDFGSGIRDRGGASTVTASGEPRNLEAFAKRKKAPVVGRYLT